MAVTDYKIESFRETVAGMPDNPTMEGWPADRVKKTFDSSAEELRVSLNGLIDYISERDEAIENKVDKQEGMGLSKNNFTDKDKVLVDTIGFKADKDNVIEKDSTVIFMPTKDAHPASKRYVDEKVNEKITELGGGDMTQAVYDPWGKKTDVFAEMDKKLDKAGGTLTGNLSIKNGSGKFSEDGGTVQIEAVNMGDGEADRRILQIRNVWDEDVASTLRLVQEVNGETESYDIFGEHNLYTVEKLFLPVRGGTITGELGITTEGSDRKIRVYLSSSGYLQLNNYLDSNNYQGIYIKKESENINEAVRLQRKMPGVSVKYYDLYGEHNKPSGSYTGNGSATDRVIQVGGSGDVLMVRKGFVCYFVTPNGIYYTGGEKSSTGTTFADGVLTIGSSDDELNVSGEAYYYTVL